MSSRHVLLTVALAAAIASPVSAQRDADLTIGGPVTSVEKADDGFLVHFRLTNVDGAREGQVSRNAWDAPFIMYVRSLKDWPQEGGSNVILPSGTEMFRVSLTAPCTGIKFGTHPNLKATLEGGDERWEAVEVTSVKVPNQEWIRCS